LISCNCVELFLDYFKCIKSVLAYQLCKFAYVMSLVVLNLEQTSAQTVFSGAALNIGKRQDSWH